MTGVARDPAAPPGDIAIGVMTVGDTPRCAELEQVLFPGDDPWPEQAFKSELAAAHNRYFVARAAGEVLAYGGIALLGMDFAPEAEIHTIGVAPAAQRCGLGTRMLCILLTIAEKRGGPVFLEVRTDNEAALNLYGRHGFHIVGVRKNYYQPSGADAYTMRRPAPGAPS